MNLVALVDDLKAIAAQHPGLSALMERIDPAGPSFPARAPLLAEAGAKAGLGLFGTLALLLKADWQTASHGAGQWRPWDDFERLRQPLGEMAAELAASEFEVLVLEQCALSCHLIGQIEVARLARRHDTERELLLGAAVEERAEFLADKRSWLLAETDYDWLLELHQEAADKLRDTRARYLNAIGKELADYVEAAHRVALMRYRLALNDPTLTTEELSLRLQHDLERLELEGVFVPFEPELRQALFDTVPGIQRDMATLRHLESLWSRGTVRLATEADFRQATMLFRRLASLILPVLQKLPEGCATTMLEGQERLRVIWDQATGTHRARALLSPDKLLNYVEHLHDWIAEAERILRCMALDIPSHLLARLLLGETLEERHADLRHAMSEVTRRLDAVRDLIAELESGTQHEEYQRIIAMDNVELKAERARMTALAERWNDEARQLSMRLDARVAEHGDDGATGGLGGHP